MYIYFSLILYLGDKLLNEHFGVSSTKRKSNLVKDTSFDDDSEIAEPLSIEVQTEHFLMVSKMMNVEMMMLKMSFLMLLKRMQM